MLVLSRGTIGGTIARFQRIRFERTSDGALRTFEKKKQIFLT